MRSNRPRPPVTAETLDQKVFISPREIAELLGVSPFKVDEIVRQHFTVLRLGPRSRRVPTAAVKVFLETKELE
jgi:excisionase family DNA binding protein